MNSVSIRTQSLLLTCALLLPLAGGGCGAGAVDIPSDRAARSALEAALSAWRNGGKPGALQGTTPSVQVHDTPWSQGEVLGSYEILGQESGAAEHEFSVKLSLSKPAKVEEVTYHVIGRDPVMVFRHEDYLRNINMENGPPLNTTRSRKPRR